jgi:hypothetical protein
MITIAGSRDGLPAASKADLRAVRSQVVLPRTMLLVLLAVGCAKEAPPAPTSAPPAPATAPAGATDACVDIRGRFDAALAKRTDACSTAADCGCYNPVGGPHLGCGGVADAATVARLAAIEQELHARRCAWTHSCAASACAPRCVGGRCTP